MSASRVVTRRPSTSCDGEQARQHRLAVDEDRAAAAAALPAAVLDRRLAELGPEHGLERGERRDEDLHLAPAELECDDARCHLRGPPRVRLPRARPSARRDDHADHPAAIPVARDGVGERVGGVASRPGPRRRSTPRPGGRPASAASAAAIRRGCGPRRRRSRPGRRSPTPPSVTSRAATVTTDGVFSWRRPSLTNALAPVACGTTIAVTSSSGARAVVMQAGEERLERDRCGCRLAPVASTTRRRAPGAPSRRRRPAAARTGCRRPSPCCARPSSRSAAPPSRGAAPSSCSASAVSVVIAPIRSPPSRALDAVHPGAPQAHHPRRHA